MTDKQIDLSKKLELLGFTKGNQVTLYGEVFELVGRPLVISDDVVLIDAIETESGLSRRVRIPLAIVSMAKAA